MRLSPAFLILALILALSPLASAQNLSGTVTNGTTHKPDAGDDVVLIKLGQGMEEAARSKTDGKGAFSFKLDDSGPHLIRVIHQGVTYHAMAPPGTTSVAVPVYDVAKKVEGISVTADVMRFQAQSGELQGVRLFAVSNKSNPPRTQMNDQNFEFYLPDGAQVDSGMAMTANGQPIASAPVPQKEKNRYAFIFPLRPEESQFEVVFHMPYNGSLSVVPKTLYGAQHFVVMLPKSMPFTPDPGTAFQAMQDPKQPDSVVQLVSNTEVGQPLGFKISGTGLLPEPNDGQGNSQAIGGQTVTGPGGRDSRPGGGLGPPIDAPDPLEKYRWYILGGFAAVLAGGAIYIAKRPPSAPAPNVAAAPMVETSVPSAPRGRTGLLLEALKEEIFEFEVEHKQGRITQQEYDKAKAALDQTLERAVKREAQKA